TSPCCPYPIVGDPYVQMIEAINCNGESFSASGATAYMSADASCRCSANLPPLAPFDPTPVDGQASVSVYTTLAWSAADPDNNLASFDLYLGTTSDPPLHAAGLTQPVFQETLPELATLYWRVVARDEWGAETTSPVWSFTTRATNSPPVVPHDPGPANGATGV